MASEKGWRDINPVVSKGDELMEEKIKEKKRLQRDEERPFTWPYLVYKELVVFLIASLVMLIWAFVQDAPL